MLTIPDRHDETQLSLYKILLQQYGKSLLFIGLIVKPADLYYLQKMKHHINIFHSYLSNEILKKFISELFVEACR